MPQIMGIVHRFTGGIWKPLEGSDALKAKLFRLASERSTKQMKLVGLRGMQIPLKKGLRKEVNTMTDPGGRTSKTGKALKLTSLKRAARKTVGSSVKKVWGGGKGDYQLKVGYGVGTRTKGKMAKATARAGSKRRGVGISAQNIHWVILGTGKYSKKTRSAREKKKTGASTGSTAPMMIGMVKAAIRSMGREAVRESGRRLKLFLSKEARKRR